MKNETLDPKIAEFVDALGGRIKTSQDTMRHFKSGIAESTFANAMERSDYAFEAAARIEVYTKALDAIVAEDTKATLETLRDYALHEVVNKSQSPRYSSYPTNLMAQERLAAWSWVLEYTNSLLGRK